jgi:tetratricopeptide (TPR) repeat protein
MVDPVLKRSRIPVKYCNIPVHHYGRLDTDRMDRKGKIYYDLGRRKLEESEYDHAAVRELATQATILGRNEEAVDLWHRFLKMSPPERSVAEAHVNLATLYLRLQDYGAARKVSEKVLSKLPKMKEARYNLALSELYLGNAEKTVAVLKHLVEDHPLYPPAQFILASTCLIIGQKEEAKGWLENLKKGPFGPVLTRSFAEIVRDLTAASRFDYAQQLLDAMLENEIVDAQILTQLSLTLRSSPQPVAVAG